MAPVRVRGCVGISEPPGTPGSSSGKPMPGAGETAHVRRLFVDRSRCALEVSPAPRRVPMSLMTGRRAVVAIKSGDTLSRRMWGRRPGRPDGWHTDVRGSDVSGVRAPWTWAPCRSLPGARFLALLVVPHERGGPAGPDTHRFDRTDVHVRSFTGVRALFPTRISMTVPGVLPTHVPNLEKVLIRSSPTPDNHVLRAGDDPAPDGYTHFQAGRTPARAADGRGPTRHTPPYPGREQSQPGRRLHGGHAMKGVLWTSSSRVDAPV